jgi:hypothetical protein
VPPSGWQAPAPGGFGPPVSVASGPSGGSRVLRTLIGIVVILVAGWRLLHAFGFTFGPPRISEVAMARSINESTMEPTDKTSTFTRADHIYCCMLVRNAKANKTSITTKWYRDGTYLDQTSLDSDKGGDLWVQFNLPAANLQSGSYKIECLLNGELQQSVTFDLK